MVSYGHKNSLKRPLDFTLNGYLFPPSLLMDSGFMGKMCHMYTLFRG